MFEAYTPVEIATKLEKSVEVTSLAAHGHSAKVYVGSKAGFLLALNGVKGDSRKRGYDVVMCRLFEKKPVNELSVVAHLDILLCLSDSQLAVHDLSEPFALKTVLQEKPLSSFCYTVSENDGHFYLAVSARKKILLYKWAHGSFTAVPLNISPSLLPDSASYMVWCGPIVAFAVQNEYFYICVFPFKDDVILSKKLFDIGSKAEKPIVVFLPDRKLIAYCRNNFLFFQEYFGTVSSLSEVKFSEPPLNIVYDAPYLLALLGKGKIEIRSVQPATHIQTIQLNKALFISRGLKGTVYVGSLSDVWLLDSLPYMKRNVERLVAEKQFELAVQLAEKCCDISDKGVVDIKRKAAFNLFCQRKFDSWLEIHAEIKTDVMTVIAHFPRLLDAHYQELLKSLLDTQPPDFPENEFRSGLQSLAPYLASVRMVHAKAIVECKKTIQNGTSDDLIEELRNHETVLQVVDTTLLKCYLQTNESLVALLLRLPDNMCILSDSEKILLEREKYYELFLLYRHKGLHEKALELLKNQAHLDRSPLRGCSHTAEYLHKLDNTSLNLILAYALWVLQENLSVGLSIFICDSEEARSLDRDRVLKFLIHECVPAVIPYLEHIIYNWREERPKFHEALGEHYISKVKQLMEDYISVLKDEVRGARAGDEEGELGEYRRKLNTFLKASNGYSPEKLLIQLRNDSLFEERALLLGRLKKHDQALALYTMVLKDYKAAENYCMEHYKKNGTPELFAFLLRLYTKPPDSSFLGLSQTALYQAEPNMAEAVRLLKEHASVFDAAQAMSSLPSDYRLMDVWSGLGTMLQAVYDRRNTTRLHKAICDAALNRSMRQQREAERVKFVVDYMLDCAICGKKIANSAFARHPNGRIEHFYCYQKKDK